MDSAGVRIVTTAPPVPEMLLETEPALVIGPEDGGPLEFYQIHDIDFLPDDRIAVVNGGTEEIRFFTSAGDHIRSIGRKGHGPGEFDGLYWLEAVGDSLLTYDSGNDRVSVLDLNGTYVRSFRLEWNYGIVTPTAVLPDRTLYGFTNRHMVELPHAGLVTDSALISIYGSEGQLLDSIGRFAHNQRVVRRAGNMQTTLGLPFSEHGQMVSIADGFCYVFGVTPEVRCYTTEGRLAEITRLAEEPLTVAPADIDAYWERELNSTNRRRADAHRRMRDAMVFPEFYPALSNLLADERGRLWVQKYPRVGDREVVWYLIDEGRWIATVRVPGSFQAMDVRDDSLLGIWRDDLGLESVRLYRLADS